MIDNPAHLHSLHSLLFTIPGIPSVYYGSEWGIEGQKEQGSDWSIQPSLDLENLNAISPAADLPRTISRLSQIRKSCAALRHGDYTELHVAPQQLAFSRCTEDQEAVVLINISKSEVPFSVPVEREGRYIDLLDGNRSFHSRNGKLQIDTAYPCWARILSRV